MIPQYARVRGISPTKSELRCFISIPAHQFLRANSATKSVGNFLSHIIESYMSRMVVNDKLHRIEHLSNQALEARDAQ